MNCKHVQCEYPMCNCAYFGYIPCPRERDKRMNEDNLIAREQIQIGVKNDNVAQGDVNSPIQLVPNKSDHDIAKELKDEMHEASKAACAVLDKAMKLGFQMQVGYGPDPISKRMRIMQIVVSKVFE